jgi:hypothetical protein
MRKHWARIFLVVGIVLFVLGLSNLNYEGRWPYSHGKYFPGDPLVEMLIGAGTIAAGLAGRKRQ